MANKITVETIVNAPIEKVWDAWNNPESIVNWAFASNDWECPATTNDLQVGGKFVTTMAAKDKSTSFDFNGTYTEVIPHEKIAYTIEGGRTVAITFEKVSDDQIKITEEFELEDINSEELQRTGWQAILNNFKNYTESL